MEENEVVMTNDEAEAETNLDEVFDTNCSSTAKLIVLGVAGAIAGTVATVKAVKKHRAKEAGEDKPKKEKKAKKPREKKQIKIQKPFVIVPKEEKIEEKSE